MKCSVCSRIVKPIVAVDIDGTLGNYYTQFVQFASWYTGVILPYDYSGEVEFSEHLGLEKALYRDIKLAYRQGSMKRSMQVYDGAQDFMQNVHDMGCEIWIATTRPWLRLDNVDPDTRHWLDRMEIEYDFMIYGDDKYEVLAQRVDPKRVIAVVDDLLEQCEEAAHIFGISKVWQPARHHNLRSQFSRRFDTFDELELDIKFKTQLWKEKQDEGSNPQVVS